MTNTAIIGLQWGDEGKGKIVDFLAPKFDAVVRFQGGHNAGHTIKVNDKTYKLSLIPSGIIQGKLAVIGSGVVIDPVALLQEVEKIKEGGINVSPQNLMIASNCPLILSIHRNLDNLLEKRKGDDKIGTTGRGIGPAYEDLCGRRALRACDLLSDAILKERIENLLSYHNLILRGLNQDIVTQDAIITEINQFRSKFLPYLKASFEITKKLQSLQNIMFEGAQGALLDVNYGTYPFVTSSNTIAGQIAIGGNIGIKSIYNVIGILKAYTTRVGSGPFPTELNNEIGDYLRVKGAEIGTVTGRNRRCGWFDIALVKQSIAISSVKEVVITKLDVLDDFDEIKICTSYKIDSKIIDYFPSDIQDWSNIEPIYHKLEGWKSITAGINRYEDLPINAKKYLNYIEDNCNVKIKIISTGPKRDETIIL